MSNLLVDVKSLSVFRKKEEVLKNINFKLKKGEFSYITGVVGSGKSTFLKILYADVKYDKGNVFVTGYNLSDIKDEQIPFLRRKLGIIFQEYMMLSDRNIFDNLKFVLEVSGVKSKRAVKTRIQEVLEKVNLSGKEERMPYELSGGEQQRAAIARALLNNPELIIADEPTGNLDEQSSNNFMKILFDITKSGTSVIMATHDHNIIKNFPATVYTVENGSLQKQ